MAERTRTRTSSAQHSTEQGVISATLVRLIQIVIFLVLTLFFSILTEWIGMATGYWEEPGSQHSEAMLAQELDYLNEDFKRSAIVDQPAQFARHFADQFYAVTIRKTGIQTAVVWLATPSPIVGDGAFRQNLRSLFRAVQDYVVAALVVTQLFAVRLAILTLAMPAFVLLAMLGLVDGLVQRDIRRWSGGRETSFVYHWAKKFVVPSLLLPWILYLAIPVSIHPNLVVLPFAILFAVSIRIMASTFKKYL